MKARPHILMAVMGVLLLVAGRTPASSQTSSLPTVTVASYGSGIGEWCLDGAIDQDYFTKVGIKLAKPIILFGDPAIVDALISKQANLALSGAASLLPVANGQTDQLIVVGGVERSPVALLTPSNITNTSQLIGQTIALPAQNTSNQVIGSALIDGLLGKGKWTPLYVGGAPAGRLAAVVAGKAAAAYINEPADPQATGTNFHILTRFAATMRYVNGGVITTKDWLSANQDTAVRFLAAYAKGCNFIINPANRARAIALLQTNTPSSEQVASATYDYYVQGPERGKTPPLDGKLNVAELGNTFQLLKNGGLITNSAFDYHTVVDLSYLNKALSSTYFRTLH